MIEFQNKEKTIKVNVKEGTLTYSQATVAGLVKAHIRNMHRNISEADEIKVSFLDPNRTDDAVLVTVTRYEE